ncbi:MAG: hypothetical protein H6813_02915 [Phycisphaeraceae bacterium]|nr:hypothetical protein [Phycisphaeraceae bacterium]MCB9848732.1 hypothetical protein [Phycisphaeraceae bacterium]
MTLSVRTNIPNLRAQHALGRAQGIVAQAAERLATGKRINRAADDPSGLIAADNLASERQELNGRISSSERQLHLLGAREGALSVIEDLFHELNGLALEAANGDALGEEEKRGLQIQAEAIYNTIDHLVQTASFNGKRILAESTLVTTGSTARVEAGLDISKLGVVTRETQTDSGETQTTTYSLKDLFGALNFVDGDVEKAAESIGSALDTITGLRAGNGVKIQQIERDVRVWGNRLNEVTDAESKIRDADFARETTELIRGQLLEQAAIEMLKVSAEIPKAALALLPGPRLSARLF